jgi:hypothetical protein
VKVKLLEKKVFVKPDQWQFGELLAESDWSKAEFYLRSHRYADVTYAVSVAVTGRKAVRLTGGNYWRRVQITFVHDGEEPSTTGGYIPESDVLALAEAQEAHRQKVASLPIDLFGVFLPATG